MRFLQVLAACQFLTSSGRSYQIPIRFGRSCQIVTSFGRSCQIVTSFGRSCQIVTSFGRSCNLLTSSGRSCQILISVLALGRNRGIFTDDIECWQFTVNDLEDPDVQVQWVWEGADVFRPLSVPFCRGRNTSSGQFYYLMTSSKL